MWRMPKAREEMAARAEAYAKEQEVVSRPCEWVRRGLRQRLRELCRKRAGMRRAQLRWDNLRVHVRLSRWECSP